ncbi:MAG: hypothetical protein WBP12_01595 [Candidatus Saccharimonas sp.]
MTASHRDLIGGIVERFVVDTVRKYDGPLAEKFREISLSAQFIEKLEDYLQDTTVVKGAIEKMRICSIYTLRDIMLLSAARLAAKCQLSEDEINIVIACLYGALRDQRTRVNGAAASEDAATKSRCSRCDEFGRVTIYITAGIERTEREMRAAFPDVSLFELAGRDNVRVERRPCDCPKYIPAR